MSLSIPKVFHQVWLGDKPIPDKFRRFTQMWINLHPGWEMKMWSEQNIEFPLINQHCYDALSVPSQLCDVVKYETVSRYGGVYLDMDFEPVRCIEPLLDGVDAFGATEDGTHLSVGIFGSGPNSDFWGSVVDRLGSENVLHLEPNVSTGPGVATRTLANDNEDVVVFDKSLFYPVSFEERDQPDLFSNARQDPKVYAIHHWAHSWADLEHLPGA